MSGWKEHKLGELTKLITKGTTPTTVGSKFTTCGVNYIKSEAIKYDGTIDKSTFVQISEETHNILKRSQLMENDILFSMAGIFLGKNAIVPKDILPANTNQALAIIRLDNKLASPRFIHYYLRQKSIVDFVNNMSGQSAQPNINFEEIKSIPILLPDIKEQNIIAAFFGNIDAKIKLLTLQNKILEELSETIFKQLFIENLNPVWEKSKIGAVLQTVLGGTPSTLNNEYWDGDIPWINSGEINNFRITEPTRFITALGLQNSNTKLLPVGTTVLAITGTTMGQISLLEIATCANQSVVGIIPNKRVSKEFVFLWVKYKIEEIISNETGGAQPHINKNDINETDIIIPPQDIMKQKIHPIANYFEKITANVFQIQTLTTLRDALLPKLMTGEINLKY